MLSSPVETCFVRSKHVLLPANLFLYREGGALQYVFFFPSSAAALALRYNKVASLTSELEQSKSDLSAAQQQVWQDQQHQEGDTLYRN